MSAEELSAKTVIELRKIAREMEVPLKAGISKAGIVECLCDAFARLDPDGTGRQLTMEEAIAKADASSKPKGRRGRAPKAESAKDAAEETQTEIKEPEKKPVPAASAVPAAPAAPAAPAVPVAPAAPAAPAVQAAPVVRQPAPAAPQAPAAAQTASGAPQFRKAWENPASRYGGRTPAPQQPRPAGGNWGNPARPVQQDAPPRMGTVRPQGFTPRFGPGAANQEQPAREQQPAGEYRGFRSAEPMNRPMQQERRPFDQDQPYGEAPRSMMAQRPAYEQPVNPDAAATQPTAAELMLPLECTDGSGVLEIHPDGYGFLRSAAMMMPSSRDIYISIAQIRRFGLRSGDLVAGKVRPQREGDKYAAMLYVTAVNDIPVEEQTTRPTFEELTPAYPSKHISLQASTAGRIIDLTAPMGFGQRALILCPPETGKEQLLIGLANTITESNPEAAVMMLLVEELPEDVTMYREKVKCQVLASTFDQTPDTHLRLADLVLERSQRLAEQGKDVVLIVDSLTRLSKVFTSSNAQQGRAMPGMVSPASLYRAKKLFGAARRLTEGGSLTIIGTMNVENGNKVDDSVVEEFRSTASTIIALDADMAALGFRPALRLASCVTRKAEMFSTPEQENGYITIQNNVIKAMSQGQALQQLQHFV